MNYARVRISLFFVMGLAVPSWARGQTPYTCTPGSNSLIVHVDSPPELCQRPGETITVRLYMACMSQSVNGYQAFLGFDPAVLDFVSGTYTSSPFALWIQGDITATNGQINLSAGILVQAGQPPTAADSLLATITFRARATVGTTPIFFRPHQPATKFSKATGGDLPATTVDSQPIHVSAACVDPCAAVVGDVNRDGRIDLADVPAAVDVLLGLDTDPAHEAAVDANCDGLADGLDIAPLIRYLLGFA